MREGDQWAGDPVFLREVLYTAFQRRQFQTEVINIMPLYPTEAVLWDENQVPSTHYTGATPPPPSLQSCIRKDTTSGAVRGSPHAIRSACHVEEAQAPSPLAARCGLRESAAQRSSACRRRW